MQALPLTAGSEPGAGLTTKKVQGPLPLTILRGFPQHGGGRMVVDPSNPGQRWRQSTGIPNEVGVEKSCRALALTLR